MHFCTPFNIITSAQKKQVAIFNSIHKKSNISVINVIIFQHVALLTLSTLFLECKFYVYFTADDMNFPTGQQNSFGLE